MCRRPLDESLVMRQGDTMLRRLTVLVAFAFVCGCNNATDHPKQPAADDKPKDGKVKPMDQSFIDETSLEFEGPSFTDADLKALPNLDKVEMLTLGDTAVTDDGCRELLRARALVEIAIVSDKVSDKTLAV